MSIITAKEKKNLRLAWLLKILGYHVTVVSVPKGNIPYLEVSAYGNRNKKLTV
jgi:hypothetical protein